MKAKALKSLVVVSGLAALSIAGLGGYIVVRYLHSSPRFDVKKVAVAGLQRVDQTQVLAQAEMPRGANVFDIDLDEVRERVEGLKWVRYATVQRVLPDTIAISVVEREPAGLARIRGAILQFDVEAELLAQDRGAGVNFPILDGLKPNDPEGNRKKVALYLRIMEDLHGQSELSEVHIDERGEVSVVSLSEPLLVNLGADDFRAKWGHYLEMRAQIQKEYPDVIQVDLRFKDQAILKTKQDDVEEEKVVWHAEKKSL
jgi:cell division protein FtsQ